MKKRWSTTYSISAMPRRKTLWFLAYMLHLLMSIVPSMNWLIFSVKTNSQGCRFMKIRPTMWLVRLTWRTCCFTITETQKNSISGILCEKLILLMSIRIFPSFLWRCVRHPLTSQLFWMNMVKLPVWSHWKISWKKLSVRFMTNTTKKRTICSDRFPNKNISSKDLWIWTI